MIRIVLVEDQTLLRDALAALLDIEDDFEIAGTFDNALAAKQMILREQPDIVLADIEMPGKSGLELAAELQDSPTRVIILTTFARPGYLRRALDAGVSGYVLKDSPGDSLPQAIRTVAAGGRAIDPELALGAWTGKNPLTERERDVLGLIAQGMSNHEIAENLALSEGTVRNYISEAISKLMAKNRTDAVRLARSNGWL